MLQGPEYSNRGECLSGPAQAKMPAPSPKALFRLALIFGIVAATVEMAVLLWFLY
jgi:hypothetical protein